MAAADLGLTNAAASAAADAVLGLIDAGAAGGTLKIYGDTRAATADTAVGAQTLLATLTFDGTRAFAAASNGQATVNTVTSDTSADDTDTATWFRVADSNGVAVFDGNVDTAASDLNLNTTAIVAGATVSISGGTYTQPKT